MKFTRLMPLLRTHDLDKTVAFYRDRLGYECTEQTSDWAFVERDAIPLMIALPNAHESFARPGFTSSFYFSTDDVDGLWRQLKDNTEIVYSDRRLRLRHAGVRDSRQ